jgi:predicted signal transduction protein with EAL and GGDEF domain
MLVQLGKSLGLDIVAEGIETNEQLVRLRAENVDDGQGFLFAGPLDAAAVGRLLDDGIVMPILGPVLGPVVVPVVVADRGDAKSSGHELQVRDRRSR